MSANITIERIDNEETGEPLYSAKVKISDDSFDEDSRFSLKSQFDGTWLTGWGSSEEASVASLRDGAHELLNGLVPRITPAIAFYRAQTVRLRSTIELVAEMSKAIEADLSSRLAPDAEYVLESVRNFQMLESMLAKALEQSNKEILDFETQPEDLPDSSDD